ncbi:hypothetical protein R21Y_30 [Vibrio phage vB_VhaS_R21Y]|nr:VHS1028 protein [Vibrio phage 1]WKV32791.1 hypothetical protein R21Y_30 [Vibrio phage vB_VhaS_R21Y]
MKYINRPKANQLNAEMIKKLQELENICCEIRACFPEPDSTNVDDPAWRTFDNATRVLEFIEKKEK